MSFDADRLKKIFEDRTKTFLHAAGQAAVNQMAEQAHIVEGTLKNSIMYKMRDGSGSGHSSKYGPGVPPADAIVSKPNEGDKVNVGSALVYAYSQERHNGFASAALDQIRGSGILERLAKEAFRIG